MATDTAPLPVSAPVRRIWQLPVFVLGLAAIWAAVTFVTPPPDAATRMAGKIDELAAALGRQSIDSAEIEPLVRVIAQTPNQSPASHYLLGSAYVVLASAMPTESPDLWKLAVQHYEACDANALKPDEIAKLAFRTAKARAATGTGNPAELIATMMNVPPGDDRAECPRLIAECALRLPQPDLARARDELTNYLGGPHRAAPAAADRYKLKLAELHRSLNEPEKARRWLLDISATAPPEIVVAAKTSLARQANAEKNWTEAVALFEAALAVPRLPTSQSNALRYEIGEVLAATGNDARASTYFEQASREPDALSGLASLHVAELRGRSAEKSRRAEAIDWLERAALALPQDKVPVEQLQIAVKLIDVYLKDNEYTAAMRAANAYGKIAPGNTHLAHRADVQIAWGEALERAGDAAAKTKFHAAAVDLTAMAEHEANHGQRTGYLRRAYPLYRRGGDCGTALQTVEALLKDNAVEPVYLAAIHVEKADLLPPADFAGIKQSLEAAMAQSGPAAATARLKLALLHVNRGQELMVNVPGSINPDALRKEAEQIGQFGRDLLRQVAEMANVPAEMQAVQEQALFELGRLGLRDAQFTDAEARFKKQLSLYPTGSYSGYGRLWLVCSLLQQARGKDNSRQLLEDALAQLKPLTQSSDPYLKTYGEIWTANTLLELGDTSVVVPMAKDLMAKYRGKPEELVAGKLLFYAYLKLPTPEPAESSRTLDRMEQAFAALLPTAYPSDPEYSHEKWKGELPKLREELRKFTP